MNCRIVLSHLSFISQSRIARTVKEEQVVKNRSAKTGQQFSKNRSAKTGQAEQPSQNRQQEQAKQNRAAGTGLPEQDSQNRTARTI